MIRPDAPPATMSVDLDNLWAYMRSYGAEAWRTYPGFLHRAVPRLLDATARLGLRTTMFVVGRDAEQADHRPLLEAITGSGHEIGNHSYDHQPWLHRHPADRIADDIARAEEAIGAATGRRPVGFRGPAFSLSTAVLTTLKNRGYRYDATTFPTVLGPLARAYHRATSRLDAEARRRQDGLFGGVREGLRPLRPYRWDLAGGPLVEVPVTTLPLLRLPVHATYLNFLADRSPGLARAYFRTTLRLCRASRVSPSLLLHATDVLGRDDPEVPAYLPGMRRSAADKGRFLHELLDDYCGAFRVGPLGEFVEGLAGAELPLVTPRFAEAGP